MGKRKLFLCFLLFLVFYPGKLVAQKTSAYTIKGKLVTPDKKQAAYTTVLWKHAGISVSADQNGHFQIPLPATNNDTLVFTATGIRTRTLAVILGGNQNLDAGIIILEYGSPALPGVEITGRMTHSYKSDYSFLGTKTQTALIDIPQAISTVTKELIEDKMDLRLKDAVTDIASVNMYSGYDEYSIRGFRADNAHLINGLRAYNTTLTSPFLVNIERIEVITGPAAVLYGNCDPGGTVNLVTKKPLSENNYGANIYIGSWNTFRATADLTGPLTQNKKLLYRFNAGYENAGSFRNGYFAKSFQFAPSISYIPNEQVQLNADFSVSNTHTIADRGQPGILNDNNLLSTPIKLNVTQPGDYLKETDLTSILSFNYKLNSHITFTSALLSHLTWQTLSEHGASDYITPDSVYLYYAKRIFNTSTVTLTNYLAFNFNTGVFKHLLITGYDYISSEVTLNQFNGELPDIFGYGSGIVGTFSLLHPQYFKRPVNLYKASPVTDNGDAPEEYSTEGAYLQEQLYYKNWELLLGLRSEFYSKEDDDDSSSTEATTNTNVLLPRVGLLYKASENLSLYATYSKGFDPFEASIVTQVFNQPFKPVYSEVNEIGAKANFLKNRLYATVAIYRITLKNVSVNANDPANPDLYVQNGKEQAKGFEVELNGNILPQFSVALSYSHNIATVLASPVQEDVGRIKENAPKNTSQSWLKYSFTKGVAKGLFLSAGHSQEGIRNTLTPGLTLPAYFIFNTGAGYIYKRMKIALNIYNITNTKYWIGGYNYENKWPGAPRNFMLNLSWLFGH